MTTSFAAIAEGSEHPISPDDSPARVLALLERVRATGLTVPSALLWRLCDDPSAPLTDLSTLRTVTHHGPPPSAADAARAAELFTAELIHVAVAETDLSSALSVAADEAVGPVDPAVVDAFLTALDEAVLGSMVRSLRAAGLFQGEKVAQSTDQIRAALGAPPAHHRVLDRWLRALVGNGYLTTDGSGFRAGRAIGDLDDAWQRARAAWASGLGSPTFVDYLRSNADHLDALVRGEQEATYLLFPQGRTDLADAVYRETITARYLNAAIAALVQELPRPLRVLEVGAGTGATTDAVLAAIGVAPTEYVFTDVSAYFLSIARERLPEWLKYERYDIDAAPPFEPRRFDLIICAGVLNNARNADRTVAGLVELLTPGGHLVITEPTREHYEILISQAFMMTAAEDARDADDGAMFLTRAQWLDILGETETVAVLPAEEHPLAPLGQRLFLVRRHLSAPPR